MSRFFSSDSENEKEVTASDHEASCSESGGSDIEPPALASKLPSYSADYVLENLISPTDSRQRTKRTRKLPDTNSKLSKSCPPPIFSSTRNKLDSEETPTRVHLPVKRKTLSKEKQYNYRRDLTPQQSTSSSCSTSSFDDASGLLESGLSKALGELTNTLKTVVKRLEVVEKKISSPVSAGSSTCSSGEGKSKVPLLVKSEVRRIYRSLLEQDEHFVGFDIQKGSSFKDSSNAKVVAKVIKEVSSANRGFQAGHIQAAIYSHYRSLCQEESLRRRGKHSERNVIRRRRERLTRKLQNRVAALNRSSANEHQKKKVMSVLVPEFMSSEESDEQQSSDTEDSYIVRFLPWRSDKVDKVFQQLDEEIERSMSKQSKRQMKVRVLSDQPSNRPLPTQSFPSWAFTNQ